MESPSVNAVSPSEMEKQRDRNRRGERGTRFSDNKPDIENRDRSRERPPAGSGKRVYVSNIPYEYRWQDLKDLFRRMVGNVEYVELFMDESNKARGCGIVEFKDPENVAKALEIMHRYELNGRELVVKEDHGEERDKYGRIARNNIGGGGGGGNGGGGIGSGNSHDGPRMRGNSSSGGHMGGRDRDDDRYSSMNNAGVGSIKNNNMPMNNFDQQEPSYNTYGLSPSFLASLRIQGPLHNKVFVANLDYKVDVKKLKQVFRMAGRVISVDLSVDKEGNSRGFAVVEFDHPVEAVQSISMFDHQMLYDRRMTVRLDRIPEKEKLPEGLGGIGMGLGPNGEPLRNVALNLPSLNPQNNIGMNTNNVNTAPVPVAAPPPINTGSMLGPNQNPNLNNLATLNNVVSNLNNLNPLLSLGLSTLANNSNDSNNPPIDISKMVGNAGANVGSHSNSASNMGGVGSGQSGSSSNVGGYSSFNSMPSNSNLSNPYGMNNLPPNQMSNSSMNSNSNVNYGSTQRDYEHNNPVRSYNTQNDDFSRMPPRQNFNSAPIGNGSGGNQSNSRPISDTILIRNLPPNCTWQTLRDRFREIGEVKFAEIRGTDCGVVRFSKERDAELAIKLKDGSRFEDRTLDVTFF